MCSESNVAKIENQMLKLYVSFEIENWLLNLPDENKNIHSNFTTTDRTSFGQVQIVQLWISTPKGEKEYCLDEVIFQSIFRFNC